MCYRPFPTRKTPEVPVLSRLGLIAALTLSIGMLASHSGYAQDDVRKRGDKACGGDSRRMCSKFFQGGDMAILLVEQFLDFAIGATSFYYVMERGQIVASGPTGQISQATVQQYLAV